MDTHLNQMGTHNIYLHIVADKKYTSCNLKTKKLLDCVLIGVCAVIRLNTVMHLTMCTQLKLR